MHILDFLIRKINKQLFLFFLPSSKSETLAATMSEMLFLAEIHNAVGLLLAFRQTQFSTMTMLSTGTRDSDPRRDSAEAIQEGRGSHLLSESPRDRPRHRSIHPQPHHTVRMQPSGFFVSSFCSYFTGGRRLVPTPFWFLKYSKALTKVTSQVSIIPISLCLHKCAPLYRKNYKHQIGYWVFVPKCRLILRKKVNSN